MDFAPRGQRLWDALVNDVLGEQGLVLLEEACRTADRLDRLDGLLNASEDAWLSLLSKRNQEDVIEVQVDGALVEARQQGAALRQLLASLPLKEPDDADAGSSWLDDVPA